MDIDISNFKEKIQAGKKVYVKSVIENQDTYTKIILKNNLISEANKDFYKKTYGSVESGISATVDKVNLMDKNLILDFEILDNFYLKFVTRKVQPRWVIDDPALVKEFKDVSDYIKYFKNNITYRSGIISPLFYDDYHNGNVYVVNSNYDWVVIDFDQMFREGVECSKDFMFGRIKHRFITSSYFSTYDKNEISDIWDSV